MTYRLQKVHDLIDDADVSWNRFLNYLQSSNHFNTLVLLTDKDRRLYNNQACSELAIICEKYSKALYLKTATIPESIISRLNLTDDDVVNIIVGSNDEKTKKLFSQLTSTEKKQIRILKFQGISHLFTKLFNNDHQFLRNIQTSFYRSIIYLKDNSDDSLQELLYSDKVYDAFVKGRYSSLNDYEADFDALLSLCEILQTRIVYNESFYDMDCVEVLQDSNYDLLNDYYNYKKSNTSPNGEYQPRLRMIKHIYPTIDSKLTIESKGSKKEYYFGKRKLVSLYKLVDINGVNQLVKKSSEELSSDIESAPTVIGLYSTDDGANHIIELNPTAYEKGFQIEDGDFILFEDNNGAGVVANIKGQLIFIKPELIKDNAKTLK